ncbi:EFR1 family ferrodoxin [Oceanirhabdus seepicola]|uniref:Ferredoxin n=1 Tax=Oceanirhabdus seepicola TaxID=2828781 RepID=A0A9J6PEZ2_9CLOT|nr:EFR1 family ferrodoxin [Oceanirhabdus seepicola]MCM1992816.1 EFR1 family ferrodoxin [Oceanirhabdus seepicola]
MKVAIVYFSGTGNTYRVGEVFKEHLLSTNHEVDLINVNRQTIKLRGYDLFIIGSPTYSKAASKKVVDFIHEYIDDEQNKSKDFITYITHSWGEAYGHITLKKHLSKLVYNVINAQPFLMPNGFYMMNHEKNTETEIEALHRNVMEKVKNMMDAYFNSQSQIDKKSVVKQAIFETMYKALSKSWIPNFANKYLSIDNKKCILCKMCVRQCPNQNIKIEDSKIVFSDYCLACAKCLNMCPQNAYRANNKTFEQYNVIQPSIISQLK